MPLWTFALRSLAYRHPLRILHPARGTGTLWQPSPQLSKSYTTALPQNQLDERFTNIPTSSVQRLSAFEHLSRSSINNAAKHSPLQRSKAPRVRVPPRQRVGVQGHNTRKTRVKGPEKQLQTPSRAVLRTNRRQIGSHPPPKPRDLAIPFSRFVRSGRQQSWVDAYIFAKVTSFTTAEKPLLASSIYWRRQFTRITAYYTNRLRKGMKWPRMPTLDHRAFEWVQANLERLGNGQQALNLEDLSFKTEQDFVWVWQQIALWLLAYDPPQMIRFLLATHVPPYVPATYVEDSLLHLARYFEHSSDPKDAIHMQRLAVTFCLLADREGKESLSFFNSFVRKLIPYCSDDQMQRMFAAINTHKVQLHPYTWLHFTSYFAKRNHFDQALDTLLEAHKLGASVNEYAFLSNCSTVLRRSSEEPDGLRVCLRVVSSLVDIGVKLDGPITDIIMLNAVEAGDLRTAFSVYHSLKERGLKPTESTFAVLLKGCKMNIDDVEMLNEIIRDAVSNINVRKSEVVATEILHCLALHHSKHNPTTAINTITEAYSQLFDLRPLQKLGLSMSHMSRERPDAEELMPPTLHAMNFMIGASIQHTLARGHKPKEIFPLYERWRELVEAGVPRLSELATTDHLANIFLMAFIRSPKSLIHAARVVRDMQRALPPSAGVEQCEPTVQSWSIFLHGFTRHGQMKLAEQVLNYMRSKGIEPNHVTWNTLLTGYARVQNVEGVVNTLRQAEQAGLVWDVWSHGGLKALRDKQKLQEELEKSRLQQSLDFTDDLKQGLSDRLSTTAEREGFGDSPADIAEQGSYEPFG